MGLRRVVRNECAPYGSLHLTIRVAILFHTGTGCALINIWPSTRCHNINRFKCRVGNILDSHPLSTVLCIADICAAHLAVRYLNCICPSYQLLFIARWDLLQPNGVTRLRLSLKLWGRTRGEQRYNYRSKQNQAILECFAPISIASDFPILSYRLCFFPFRQHGTTSTLNVFLKPHPPQTNSTLNRFPTATP